MISRKNGGGAVVVTLAAALLAGCPQPVEEEFYTPRDAGPNVVRDGGSRVRDAGSTPLDGGARDGRDGDDGGFSADAGLTGALDYILDADGGVAGLTCTGIGRIGTVADSCIGDYGNSALGDSIEFYCEQDVVRACLSGERCPWRDGASNGAATCSRAGLTENSARFAVTVVSCGPWRPQTWFCCSDSADAGTDSFSIGPTNCAQ